MVLVSGGTSRNTVLQEILQQDIANVPLPSSLYTEDFAASYQYVVLRPSQSRPRTG